MDVKSFRRDPVAMRDGEWISPGPEYGDLKIKCRNLGHRYLDSVALRVKREARNYGSEAKIPSEVRARINTEAMIEIGLIDVDGLTDGGKPVSFQQFCEMLLDPAFAELSVVAFGCCSQVGRAKAEDLQDAVGNSAPAFAND